MDVKRGLEGLQEELRGLRASLERVELAINKLINHEDRYRLGAVDKNSTSEKEGSSTEVVS